MVAKVILLIFDGLGGRPIAEFGGQTPLESADSPNFDKLATNSGCGLMHTLGRGAEAWERYFSSRNLRICAGEVLSRQRADRSCGNRVETRRRGYRFSR